MPKFPDPTELGGVRGGGGRAVARPDLMPAAQGLESFGQSIGQGGQAIATAVGNAGKLIGQGEANLGKGLGDAGAGLLDLRTDENRWQYSQASSDFLAKTVNLRSTYSQDNDYATLEDRFTKDINKTAEGSAALIQDPAMRERFVTAMKPQLAQDVANVRSRADTLESDSKVAYVSKMGDTAINQGAATTDPNLQAKIIKTHSDLIDGLAADGTITQVRAAQMKQEWAHQYAIAEGLERSKTDPTGVINDLRAAPGSTEATVNRIIHAEGTAQNPSSSANGTGQFTDKTWVDLVRQKRPDLAAGQSDQDILAMRADKSLARDMVTANLNDNAAYLKNSGVAATPTNLYLAHFLGPQAAAAVAQADPKAPIGKVLAEAVGPDQAAKMIQANAKVLAGQQTGSVQAWAAGQMGGASAGGVHIYDILRPDQRALLLDHAENALRKQDTDDQSNLKQRVDDSLAEAGRLGIAQKPVTLSEFIAARGAVEGPKVFKQYTDELGFLADKKKVATMAPADQMALLKQYEPQPGSEGYKAAAGRQDRLSEAISAADHPALKQRVDDTLTEATRTGAPQKPVTQAEFVAAAGEAEGAKAYKLYTDELGFLADQKRVAGMTPDEQAAARAKYQPAAGDPGYEAAVNRSDRLAKAIKVSNDEKATDPAAFTIAHMPAAGDAFKAFLATASNIQARPADKAAAARDYATKATMDQGRIGIAPDDVKLAPQAYIDHLDKAFTTVATSEDPQARLGLIARVTQEKQMWGDAWPKVMSQLPETTQPIVRAIAAGANPQAMSRLLALPPKESPVAILKEQDEVSARNMTKAVNTAMAPWHTTLVGPQQEAYFSGYNGLVQKLAALYIRDGHTSPETAATNAYNAVIGDRYKIRDTYAVPVDPKIDVDAVQRGTLAARDAIVSAKTGDAASPFGSLRLQVNDLGVSDNEADSRRNFARNGTFVTSPKEDGLNIAYGKGFVSDKDGKRILLTWDQLQAMGTGRSRREVPFLAGAGSRATAAPAQPGVDQ